jgi:hypothetical protein
VTETVPEDYCQVCTCWIWEALGWLPPNHRCADLGLTGDRETETEPAGGAS